MDIELPAGDGHPLILPDLLPASWDISKVPTIFFIAFKSRTSGSVLLPSDSRIFAIHGKLDPKFSRILRNPALKYLFKPYEYEQDSSSLESLRL